LQDFGELLQDKGKKVHPERVHVDEKSKVHPERVHGEL
jgi:hypothetical protein